jgi:hypothetical protein
MRPRYEAALRKFVCRVSMTASSSVGGNCRDRGHPNRPDLGYVPTHDQHRDQRDDHRGTKQRQVGVRTAGCDDCSAGERAQDRAQSPERDAEAVPVARTSVG